MVGSAWVISKIRMGNFKKGLHPVDETKYTDKALTRREAADLDFCAPSDSSMEEKHISLTNTNASGDRDANGSGRGCGYARDVGGEWEHCGTCSVGVAHGSHNEMYG